MTADVIALRAHLVAEAEQAQRKARRCQRWAEHEAECSRHRPHIAAWQHDAAVCATTARTATDAWLAADARLRALDGLIAAVRSKTPG